MACARCNDLIPRFDIHSPSALKSRIRLVCARVRDHTLLPLPPNGQFETFEPFSDLEEDGPWPDWFTYRFECFSCRQRFALSAEVYHGSGGEWRAISPTEDDVA